MLLNIKRPIVTSFSLFTFFRCLISAFPQKNYYHSQTLHEFVYITPKSFHFLVKMDNSCFASLPLQYRLIVLEHQKQNFYSKHYQARHNFCLDLFQVVDYQKLFLSFLTKNLTLYLTHISLLSLASYALSFLSNSHL